MLSLHIMIYLYVVMFFNKTTKLVLLVNTFVKSKGVDSFWIIVNITENCPPSRHKTAGKKDGG